MLVYECDCACVPTLRHIAAAIPACTRRACANWQKLRRAGRRTRWPRARLRSVVGERAASGPVARHAARRGASAGGRVAGTAATSRRGGHVLRRGPGPRTMWRLGGDTGDGRVRGVPPAPCVARACIPAWPRLPRTHAGASPAALADSFPALPWPRWVRCIACQLPRQKSSLSLSRRERARHL